jgi:very-short-patch-repair endonuclease
MLSTYERERLSLPALSLKTQDMHLNLDPKSARALKALAERSPSATPMFLRSELVAAGLDGRAIRNLLEDGSLVRHERGVYAANVGASASPELVRIQAHDAASSGQSHIYTHTSAAHIWGLSVWRARPVVHVAHASRRGDGGPLGDVVRHNQRIPARDVRLVDALRVTSLERTIVDCARLLPFEQAVVIADSGLSRGADEAVLQRLVSEGKATRGIRKVREALLAADGRSESPAESRFRLLLAEWNLPEPELQLWIQTATGHERVDFGWPNRRIVIEVHGYGKYFDYLPIDEKVAQQQAREARLLAAGWRVLNVYWPELDDPVALGKKVKAFVRTPHAAVQLP